ncbi:MAG: NifB/NifX family molybdenum-iron cluster-binding protein [Deltaproteobacteria bacterium]|nr:NifB/NifX family molybdenum-iron cluster-binding protein [Deltaproteobacteria bacterium]MCD6137890.1 NifB/NifX family molybdenum-iron cluster-binding protein [Deltaproteobacteria bacterium]RLB87891.1 MAG: diguanylate cyclase [Deltaproteobacteria bacterium]RLB91066.1 MAG: diguanylate cyclase [Deltaproteobacteria bacterium]RLC10547.1 MAG: diguanylate cyclase [Deltaproteobacteria bacterium]
MIVAITSKGKTLEAEMELRFSRSPFFIIADTETGEFKAFKNPGASAKDAACVDAVKFLVSQGVKAILTGNIGHNAFTTVKDTQMKIYWATAGTVGKALEKFKKRRLLLAKEPSVGFREGLRTKPSK